MVKAIKQKCDQTDYVCPSDQYLLFFFSPSQLWLCKLLGELQALHGMFFFDYFKGYVRPRRKWKIGRSVGMLKTISFGRRFIFLFLLIFRDLSRAPQAFHGYFFWNFIEFMHGLKKMILVKYRGFLPKAPEGWGFFSQFSAFSG